MKKTKAIIFSFFSFFLLACSARHGYNQQLVLADSLMQLQPDSTLFILQNISNQELATQADSAYYALLMTQAKDQNCVLQTNDSLIRIAAYYYDAIGDIVLQAKAHYYYGCVWRDKIIILKLLQSIVKLGLLQKKQKTLIYCHAYTVMLVTCIIVRILMRKQILSISWLNNWLCNNRIL